MDKSWIILFCAVGIVSCASFSKPTSKPPPKWPAAYTVNGTLSLPYAELEEPFMAYYDVKNNRSRIDFYAGVVQTYMRGDMGKNGTSFKIAYMTNKKVYNAKTCFQTNGTADAKVTAQSILPDLTDFQEAKDTQLLNGVNVTVWWVHVKNGNKTSKYTMYVTTDQMKPVRYEMYGYDSLLGSHFDKYYVDYTSYNDGPVPAKIFDVPTDLKCSGFPGPGDAESRILSNPMREYIDHDDTHHQEMFNKFKKFHNKNYRDDSEHAQREAVFRQNVRYIHSKNRSPISYTLAVNHLVDMSREELRVRNGRRPSGARNNGKPVDKNIYKLAGQIPDHHDWRLYGAVTPVKDQAVCGSCWSFGTTGTIEGAYFRQTGKLVRLSQQELMDCSWGYGNNACDGGEDFRAYDWIKDNKGGLATEDDYGSYKAVDFKCKSKTTNGTVQIDDYFNITSGDQLMLKMSLFTHGPISVAIDASHLSLSFYANGVYYEEKCRNDDDGLDHAVLAVGYGIMHEQEYWLVKNSWSTYWGNDGYVLMSMKNNNCGVATSATFVSVKK